jgi:L-amino acid N-acyltransferase YncA
MVEIRPLEPADWPDVERIFVDGIATRNATFETEPPSWPEFDHDHLPDHRLVAVEDGRVLGWATLAPTSSRDCYSGVTESSVYVAEAARGRGVGLALMTALLAGADAAGIWTVQAAMFSENLASVRLHGRLGFRVVGRRERIARLDGAWRDTLLLERRSAAG